MGKVLVGKVVHYFGKIGVAALKITGSLSVGDKIVVEHADKTKILEDTINSMEVNHAKVNNAKPGDDIAVKLSGPVHDGNLVYKITL